MTTVSSPQIPAEILTSIYTAAFDPARWTEAVAQITRWTGGDVGSLAARRLDANPETVRVTSGVDPRFSASYVSHLRTDEPYPCPELLTGLPVGRALRLRDIVAQAQVDPSSYFHQLMQAQKLKHLQAVLPLRSANWVLTMATARREGRDFDRQNMARLEVAASHIGDALRGRAGLDAVAESNEPALRLVQQMGLVGIFQTDRTGHVLHGHDHSEQLSTSHALVRIERRRLRARTAKDQKRLAGSLAHAVRGKSSVLVLGKGESALYLGLVPGPRRSPISPERSVSVIFAPSPLRPSQVAAGRFETLTPALRSVADLVAQGLTDKEIASRLNLPVATARTYVTRVLKRLEVSNRRELMRRTGTPS